MHVSLQTGRLPLLLAFILSPIGAYCQPAAASLEDVRQHLAAAQEAERRKDYPAASSEYEAILQKRPDLAIIRQSLAVTYHLQNRFDDAIPEFQKALKLDPRLWGSLIFLGMDYYKANRFEQAIAPLRRSLELNAKMAEPEARFWLGVAYVALRKLTEAIAELRRAAELRPNDLEVLYQLTRAYDQAAGAAFERIGAIQPGAAAAFLLQGERFAAENRSNLARIEFRSAIQLRPDYVVYVPADMLERNAGPTLAELTVTRQDAHALLELGSLYADAGATDRAEVVLRSLVANKPADEQAGAFIRAAEARLQGLKPAAMQGESVQGLRLLDEGRGRAAVPLLEKAVSTKPSVCLRTALLRAYSESDEPSRAESLATELLRAHPGDIDLLHLLGRHYKRLAASTLQTMIDRDPDAYRVHELQASRFEERTDYSAAIREYEAALQRNPDAAGLRYAVGNAYANLKQNDKAEQYLKDELQRNPHHTLAQARLGSLYAEQGQAEEAIFHLEAALRSNPNLNGARLDLCRAYMANSRFAEAVAGLRQVASADPDNDRVHYLLANAYTRQGRREDAQAEMAKYQQLTRKRLERTQRDVRDVSGSLSRQP